MPEAQLVDEGFLDLIYDSALDTSLWPQVLQRLANGAGGEGAALVWQDLTTNAVHGVNARLDPDAVALFSGHFATRNPLRPSAAAVRRLLPTWSPRIILDEERLPKADFMKTEFYNDFFVPFGFHSSASLGLAVEGIQGGTIDILRGPRKGRFNEGELRFCGEAHPHLIRAFRLGRKLAAGRALEAGMAERFQQAAFGVFILSPEGLVRQMNPVAEDITRRGAGLRVARGHLVAVEDAAARRLQVLIGRAGASDAEVREGGSMAAPVPHRRLALSLLVIPVRTDTHAVFRPPSVMVCATDLERGLDLPAERLRALFGLTAAESRLARALFDGADLAAAAAALGIAPNTAKVHLAHIFEKTGVNRQGALVKLMTRCAQDHLD